MKNTISIMKKDYILMRYNKSILASFILWLPVLMLVSPDSFFIIMVGSFMLLMATFGIEEGKRELMNSLPIIRKDMFLSKYIMFFINSIVLIIYMLIIYLVFKQLNFKRANIINWDVIITIITTAVYIFSFAISISENATVLPVGALPVAFINLFRSITGYDDMETMEIMVINNKMIINLAIGAFIISIFISLYKCRRGRS